VVFKTDKSRPAYAVTKYLYLVQTYSATAVAGFEDVEGLEKWLMRRGLPVRIPQDGEIVFIEGAFREELHWTPGEQLAFLAIENGWQFADWSNGRKTMHVSTLDSDGVVTVHCLNPNVKNRPEFGWSSDRPEFGWSSEPEFGSTSATGATNSVATVAAIRHAYTSNGTTITVRGGKSCE
jgi:hypothetical protein